MSFEIQFHRNENRALGIGSDRGFRFRCCPRRQHGRLQLVMANDRTLSELLAAT